MLDEYSFVKKALMFEIVPTITELKIVKRDFLYFSDILIMFLTFFFSKPIFGFNSIFIPPLFFRHKFKIGCVDPYLQLVPTSENDKNVMCTC